MPVYAFKIEYDGAPFSGWQRQRSEPSVQAALEAALARLDPAAPVVQGAGRTDAGVHATGQVAHAELSRTWDTFRLGEAMNAQLRPAPVAVLAVAAVADDFHARFAAISRSYVYRIATRRAPETFRRGQVWRTGRPLALDAMRAAAAHLVGQHDFTTFRASLCQARSPVKTLDHVTIDTEPGPCGTDVVLRFGARSFLHSQVRSMVGTLERVGFGQWSPGDVAEALAACDRSRCGPVAPPDGLYLTRVGYPQEVFGSGQEDVGQEDAGNPGS